MDSCLRKGGTDPGKLFDCAGTTLRGITTSPPAISERRRERLPDLGNIGRGKLAILVLESTLNCVKGKQPRLCRPQNAVNKYGADYGPVLSRGLFFCAEWSLPLISRYPSDPYRAGRGHSGAWCRAKPDADEPPTQLPRNLLAATDLPPIRGQETNKDLHRIDVSPYWVSAGNRT